MDTHVDHEPFKQRSSTTASAMAQEEVTNAGGLIPSASTRKPTLMGLPQELRDKIYDFVVEQNATSFATFSPMRVPVTCVVSKQMLAEALPRYLANTRWEFNLVMIMERSNLRKPLDGPLLLATITISKANKVLFKKWLDALAEDARHLASCKIICELRSYRWKVYISLVANSEQNGARNVDADERDENSQPAGSVYALLSVNADGTPVYHTFFPPSPVWKDPDPPPPDYTRGDGYCPYPDGTIFKNLKEEINEYIENDVVKPVAQKRMEGTLTVSDIEQAFESLTSHKFEGW